MTSPVGSPTMVNPSGTAGSSGSSSASGASSSIGGLTMNDFLTLMTAQLQNQDPLNPTDSNQFLTQLSELSTVEGISQLNTSMSTLSNSMLSSQALTAASLVGQGVLAPATSAFYTSGTAMTGAVQVPSGATNVVLSITNAGGALVDQLNVPASAGLQSFSWNGTDANGQALPSGTYSISAAAQVGGSSQAASTLINGTVTSVTLGATGSSPTLNTLQLGPVPLSSVQQID
ncbi:MAG TPA: flagellar hook capping FlgD N-terminal domain-containing protein [Steroidobacteraceae bacterium]|jgi:flagellar basal-body rod modification protein FlgD|nr:flagellar hook capping FlgD N-terminal domain-containing protein [Steroidobacteraceae bacterium]